MPFFKRLILLPLRPRSSLSLCRCSLASPALDGGLTGRSVFRKHPKEASFQSLGPSAHAFFQTINFTAAPPSFLTVTVQVQSGEPRVGRRANGAFSFSETP